MKTLSSTIFILLAVFMMACGGNANNAAETTEESTEVVADVATDECCEEGEDCEGCDKTEEAAE